VKTVALKFCGGCNPTYDRLQYWEQIKAKTNGMVNWVGADQAGCDAILIISGCHSACPEKNFQPADYRLFITVTDNETSPEEIAKKILTWGEK
jgi:hypothetical protein